MHIAYRPGRPLLGKASAISESIVNKFTHHVIGVYLKCHHYQFVSNISIVSEENPSPFCMVI